MKVNKKLMRKVREACKTTIDRCYVRELFELANEPHCGKYIWPMLDSYEDYPYVVRSIIGRAETDSSLNRQEVRGAIAGRPFFNNKSYLKIMEAQA